MADKVAEAIVRVKGKAPVRNREDRSLDAAMLWTPQAQLGAGGGTSMYVSQNAPATYTAASSL